ncbi:MAG TPA: aspartyl protease family protein, partial [Thermoanaerobaculia bacterium]|nr:aspartyl protease family protein [Thermoanaerobaculia bacterium]
MNPRRVATGLVLVAALLAHPGSRVAAADPPRAIADVPFALNGHVIFLPVSVNGSPAGSFVLDTGAQGSSLNTRTANTLRLPLGRGGTSHGAGGAVASHRLTGVTLGVGEARLEKLDLAAIELAPLESNTGRPIDGILGSDLFRRYVVEIDYETKLMRLYEPSGFEAEGRGASLPLRFEDQHPYVRAAVTLPGRGVLDGEFVLDLGSNFALILLPSFIEEKKLRDSLPPTIETFGRGVGGEVGLPIGRASRLQIGAHALEAPVTAFPRSGTFGRKGKAGNIGSAVLRRFRLTFDYPRSRMFLEPNGRFGDPFEFDMSGLQLVTESPAFDVVRVNRVLPNSPAAEAGLRPADEILSVAGRPAAAMRLAELREMLRQPDREYPLRIKRGSETLSVTLKTRRLV